MRTVRHLVFLFACICMVAGAPMRNAKAEELRAVTAVFAPLQMEVDGELTGYAVETVKELMRRLEAKKIISKSDIQLFPWKRAMRNARNNKNTLFFSLSRNKEREKLFHWIGEISPYDVYLFKLKDTKLPEVTSLADMEEKGVRLAVQIGSNMVNVLDQQNLYREGKYTTYTHYNLGIPMLFGKRFDVMPLTRFVARTNVCKLGYDGDAIEPYLQIKSISKPLWLVMNKETSPELVRAVEEEFQALQYDGFINRQQASYLKQWHDQPCVKDQS